MQLLNPANRQDMNQVEVDLSLSRGNVDDAAGPVKRVLWHLASLLLFQWCPLRLYGLKAWFLRRFGAHVGKRAVIKQQVKIARPWNLTMGDDVWLGEECWLLNFAQITIESKACISQRAMLCTGNHDYKCPTFDVVVRPIYLEQGCWIAAGAFVGPGVRAGSHAVLTAGSVMSRNLDPYTVYSGNPAVKVRMRNISN